VDSDRRSVVACSQPTVRNGAERPDDPFDFDRDSDRYVGGHGDANAHVHVIGDHPGV
jgi:hypothetical protein